jgi:PhnB protein
MAITTTTHLNFRGDARAALEFYQSVFGGKTQLFTHGDAGTPVDPSEADRITWGEVRADNGFHVMAYDVPSSKSYDRGDKPVFVSVRGDADSIDEVTSYWNGLAEGATVVADLGPAPWGAPLYGMLEDRFGVTWVLDVVGAY